MLTTLILDNELVLEARRISGLDSEREVVEEALRLLIQRAHQRSILANRGKLNWEGDLQRDRLDRLP